MEKEVKRLSLKRQKMVKGMPGWESIIRGSVVKYYLRCGKKGCRCKKEEGYRHGPYYYLSVKGKGGKTKMKILPGWLKGEVEAAVREYNKMRKHAYKISEINFKELLIKGKERSRKG